jgi:hypothetical protein
MKKREFIRQKCGFKSRIEMSEKNGEGREEGK